MIQVFQLFLLNPIGKKDYIRFRVSQQLMIKEIFLNSESRNSFIDVTGILAKHAEELNNGTIIVHIPHTTAGITINEGADPCVREDITNKLTRLIPREDNYKHDEGNSDAHIKSSIIGNTITLIIDKGKIILGEWQRVFFCEFDGPRKRKIILKMQH